jgi:hypothetical protein
MATSRVRDLALRCACSEYLAIEEAIDTFHAYDWKDKDPRMQDQIKGYNNILEVNQVYVESIDILKEGDANLAYEEPRRKPAPLSQHSIWRVLPRTDEQTTKQSQDRHLWI